jgi:hypothetical protein
MLNPDSRRDGMIASRFTNWPRRFSVAAAAVVIPGVLAAQEPRPLELRSWSPSRAVTAPLSLSGDVTTCTLVRCEQTASLFARTTLPFRIGLVVGARMNAPATKQLGQRSALGSAYADYDAGPLRFWAGATTGGLRREDGIGPDPAPGIESGLSVRWRSVAAGLSAAGGALKPIAGNGSAHVRIVTVQRQDSLGTHVDTLRFSDGDSSGIAGGRWSSTEARITWREDRWWITARAGRLQSTWQSLGFWGGVQAGADLTRGVSLLLGVGTSSRSLAYVGGRNATPHFSMGFGFNTAVFSRREPRPDSVEASARTARPFVISDLGGGRYRLIVRLPTSGRLVEMACDCDGWKPTPMIRAGDAWIVEVQARPGMHHVSIRVDGSGWIAPPGLAPVDDDFAGQSGLFVVP